MHQGQDMWQLKAACRGPQAAVFFPPSHAERKEEKASREMRAKTICDQCRVRGDCLEYAIRIRAPRGTGVGRKGREHNLFLARGAAAPATDSPPRPPPPQCGGAIFSS